jgi:hypothetical protein
MPSTHSLNNKDPKIISIENIYKGKNVLAFIIDGEIVDIFFSDERFSSILQSNPIIVELNNVDPMLNGPHIGWKYDGKNFYPPSIDNN